MKKVLILLLIAFFSVTALWSQSVIPGSPPEGFSYKATIIKANGAIVANKVISLRISILQGSTIGTVVYSEDYSPRTSEYGQVDVVIGSDGLPFIYWDQGPFYLKTEIDDKGGTNYSTMSIIQLLSVPYALYSGTSTTVSNINYNEIIGTPILSSVATSGDYKDLFNTPTLFDGSWNSLFDKPNTLGGYGIEDAMSTSHPSYNISQANITDWNNAVNWGNHADAGYVTLIGAQTLTNKTLTSPVINSPTGLSKADVGLNYVDNTTDELKPVSIATQEALDLKENTLIFNSPLSRSTNIISLQPATNSSDGFLSSSDKTKLDGLQNADGSETHIVAGENITVSGNGTNENPYTINAPDAITGTMTLTRVLSVGNDAGGNNITNLASPLAENDAATKTYVDALESRISTLETQVATLLASGNDADGDGFTAIIDCNDNDPNIHPGATEICDGTDNDCDGNIDEDCAPTSCTGDGDCPEGFYCDNDACVPKNANGSPCTDGGQCLSGICFNGFCVSGNQTDQDGDGFMDEGGDCNDGDPTIYPGAAEVCDGKDNDCDGFVDEGCEISCQEALTLFLTCATDNGCGINDLTCINQYCNEYLTTAILCLNSTCLLDLLNDPNSWPWDENWTNEEIAAYMISTCGTTDEDGDGITPYNGDCNDNNASIHPGAEDFCDDGIDQNCDGKDQVCNDNDGDGFAEIDDCNDNDPTIHPGATEICEDGIDQDCNGSDLSCDDFDNDGDGYTENDGDCNDADASTYPGAIETCGDGIDQNCDGSDLICDEDIDNDGDGYTENEGDCNDTNASINPGADEICEDGIDQDCKDGDLSCDDFDNDGDGYTENEGDCDDGNPAINPDAIEIPDGIDNDCDGFVDNNIDPGGENGVPINGFPNWEEQMILVLTNRARCDPDAALVNCTPCADVDNGCYSVAPPLEWDFTLNKLARFHAINLTSSGCGISHDSPCELIASIGTDFPNTRDGSVSSSCVGGVATCSMSEINTSYIERFSLFGIPSGYRSENMVTNGDPKAVFNLWLLEESSDPTCGWGTQHGHRYNILNPQFNRLGVGVSGGYIVQDFWQNGSLDTRIPSGSHWPKNGGSNTEFRANWYDPSGGAPNEAKININGEWFDMNVEFGTGGNATYLFTTNISEISWYYFRFRDSNGSIVTYPGTGAYGVGSIEFWRDSRP